MKENVWDFIEALQIEIDATLDGNYIGTYIHGSLALGGFNEATSDIDVLVVTKSPIALHVKQQLITMLLARSCSPYLIEISF